MIYQELNTKIDLALQSFEQELLKVQFPTDKATYFTVCEELSELSLPQDSRGAGVYFFELNINSIGLKSQRIETKIKVLQDLWTHKSVRHFWTPSIRKLRLNQHLVEKTTKYKFENEWIPFYIGKSQNLQRRIREHIFQDTAKTTFGMKLKGRKNIHGFEFKVSYILIPVKHYAMIVPFVENEMRKKLNPIVGKQ